MARADQEQEAAGFRLRDPKAATRMLVCLLLGAVAGLVLAVLGPRSIAPLAGWDVAALAFVAWVWLQIARADADRTARLAVREDPSSAVADVVLLLAAVASLVGVGYVIVLGSDSGGTVGPALGIPLSIVSVAASWSLVHTIFTLRYARLYYHGEDGGVDFNSDEPPDYVDFAYLAFTIGMTFQVSDTDLTSRAVRGTALRHALVSYLFGAVIIAITINLVAGLTKG